MDDGDYLSLLLVFFLLLFSAYFSGSETAFFSISKFKINQLKQKKKEKSLLYLLERPRKLLITIILGNTFVNIFATVTATEFFIDKFGVAKGNIIASILMTLALLFFGEITPKIIAVNLAGLYARISAPFMKFVMHVLTPISFFLLKIVNLFLKLFGMTEYSVAKHISQEELKTIIDMGNEEGVIKYDEKEMLRSVFEFSDTDVNEIMTPRIDMLCIDVNDSFEDIKKVINDEQFSRIPVYEDNIDNIMGILYVKDILPYMAGLKKMDDIRPFLRPAYFVPESKHANSLLKLMQQKKTHIVLVADEYGGTEGLVTMEDVIEELVGEIHDEHDEEDKEYEFFNENVLIAQSKMHIEDLNELMGFSIPENPDYSSLSGYIMHKTGNIPSENDIIRDSSFDIVVLKMDGNRIEKVKIIRKEIV